jgi:hypothetical protein
MKPLKNIEIYTVLRYEGGGGLKFRKISLRIMGRTLNELNIQAKSSKYKAIKISFFFKTEDYFLKNLNCNYLQILKSKIDI